MISWDAFAIALVAVSGGAAFAWIFRWYRSVVQTTARSKAVKREFAAYNRGRAPGAEMFSARNVVTSRRDPLRIASKGERRAGDNSR